MIKKKATAPPMIPLKAAPESPESCPPVDCDPPLPPGANELVGASGVGVGSTAEGGVVTKGPEMVNWFVLVFLSLSPSLMA
jgi:hypothetical protein